MRHRVLTGITRALTGSAILGGFLLGTVTPAIAQDLTLPDTSSDVATWSHDDQWLPAPTRTFGDITSTRLRHGDYRVWVRLQFADLSQTVGDELSVNIKARTDEGLRRIVAAQIGPGYWKGDDPWMSKVNGPEIGCAGLVSIFDYDRSLVRIGIPRACLSNPYWVRLKIDVQTRTWGGEGGSSYYVDDPFRSTPVSVFPDDQKWSPYLFHGPLVR